MQQFSDFRALAQDLLTILPGGAAQSLTRWLRDGPGFPDRGAERRCAGLPDRRKGPRRDGEYTMADIGLSAFAVFFMGSPSFLGHHARWPRATAGRTARPCSA